MTTLEQIIKDFETGNRDEAIAQVKELKNRSFYIEAAPFLNPKNEVLFISNLTDIILFFQARPEYIPEAVAQYTNLHEIWSSILYCLVVEPTAKVVVSTKDSTYFLAEFSEAAMIAKKLFNKDIQLNLPQAQVALLSASGIDSIECDLLVINNALTIQETQDLDSQSAGFLESFKETLLVWAAKNITPKTISVASIALSVGMSLMGNTAHAHVADVSNYLSVNEFQNSLEQIRHSLDGLDATHAHLVSVTVNKFYPSQYGGSGHFNIAVGDCAVEGNYEIVRTAGETLKDVIVNTRVPHSPEGTMCSQMSDLLKGELETKINEYLDSWKSSSR
jgi:hypothetical protein